MMGDPASVIPLKVESLHSLTDLLGERLARNLMGDEALLGVTRFDGANGAALTAPSRTIMVARMTLTGIVADRRVRIHLRHTAGGLYDGH